MRSGVIAKKVGMTRLFLEEGRTQVELGGEEAPRSLNARGDGEASALRVTLAPFDPQEPQTREHVLLARQVGVVELDLAGGGGISVGPILVSTTNGDDLVRISVLDAAAPRGRGPDVVVRTGRGDDEVELLAVAGQGEPLDRVFVSTGQGADDVVFYLANESASDGFVVDVSTGAGADRAAGKTITAPPPPPPPSQQSGASDPAPSPAGRPAVDRISMGAGDDQLGRYFCDENRDDVDPVGPGRGPTSIILLGSGDDMALVDQFSPIWSGGLRVMGGRGEDVIQVNVTGWDFLSERAARLPSVWGGEDADVFVLERGETSARVRDFEAGEDLIALAGGLAFSDLTIEARGRGAAVFDADGALLALVDARKGRLDASELGRDAFVRHDAEAFDVPPEPERALLEL